jgi:hypothetical protein
MDRIHRTHIDAHAIADRPRETDPGSEDAPRGASAARAVPRASGILRELAEQMRHWD